MLDFDSKHPFLMETLRETEMINFVVTFWKKLMLPFTFLVDCSFLVFLLTFDSRLDPADANIQQKVYLENCYIYDILSDRASALLSLLCSGLQQDNYLFLLDVILIFILTEEGWVIRDDQALQEGAPDSSW